MIDTRVVWCDGHVLTYDDMKKISNAGTQGWLNDKVT